MIIGGKIFGALLGFIAYGSPGLILGLVFGHIFDKSLQNVLYAPRHNSNVRMQFFKTVFQTIGNLAKADGVVSEREVQVARDIMLNDFNLDQKQMNMAIDYFNEGKQNNFDLNAALVRFKLICGGYTDLRRFFLELVIKASLADRVLRETQYDKLVMICNVLGIQLSELEYQLRIYGYTAAATESRKRQSYTNSGYNSYSGTTQTSFNQQLTDAYSLLGVKSSDTDKIIKNAYRRMMSKYHPDKLVAKGLPPEMMDIAKVKTQQISAAYALIMRSRR